MKLTIEEHREFVGQHSLSGLFWGLLALPFFKGIPHNFIQLKAWKYGINNGCSTFYSSFVFAGTSHMEVIRLHFFHIQKNSHASEYIHTKTCLFVYSKKLLITDIKIPDPSSLLIDCNKVICSVFKVRSFIFTSQKYLEFLTKYHPFAYCFILLKNEKQWSYSIDETPPSLYSHILIWLLQALQEKWNFVREAKIVLKFSGLKDLWLQAKICPFQVPFIKIMLVNDTTSSSQQSCRDLDAISPLFKTFDPYSAS